MFTVFQASLLKLHSSLALLAYTATTQLQSYYCQMFYIKRMLYTKIMSFLLYSSGFMVCRHGDGLLCPHPSVQARALQSTEENISQWDWENQLAHQVQLD